MFVRDINNPLGSLGWGRLLSNAYIIKEWILATNSRGRVMRNRAKPIRTFDRRGGCFKDQFVERLL